MTPLSTEHAHPSRVAGGAPEPHPFAPSAPTEHADCGSPTDLSTVRVTPGAIGVFRVGRFYSGPAGSLATRGCLRSALPRAATPSGVSSLYLAGRFGVRSFWG